MVPRVKNSPRGFRKFSPGRKNGPRGYKKIIPRGLLNGPMESKKMAPWYPYLIPLNLSFAQL